MQEYESKEGTWINKHQVYSPLLTFRMNAFPDKTTAGFVS